MEQTELFYFSKNDLMISVAYDKLESMASYKCHRVMKKFETELIEKYIEMIVLGSTHAIVVYFGEDKELLKTWDEFHSQNHTIKPIKDPVWEKDETNIISEMKEKFPPSARKKLLSDLQGFLIEGISSKMISDLKVAADKGFCFDRIGDILRDRNEKHSDEPDYRMKELETYVKEYNQLNNKQITIKSLIT